MSGGEPRLFLGSALSEPDHGPLVGGEVAAMLLPSPLKGLRANEDSAGYVPVSPHQAVLVLADGLGGAPDGDQASQCAVRELCAAVHEGDGTLRERILAGFDAAELAVRHLGDECATTLVAVEIQPGYARTYHSGDSQALVVGGAGELRWRTTPHSPVGYAVEAGVLDPTDAMFADQRHLVSSVVGAGHLNVEVSGAITTGSGDAILLASDGLLDNLFEDEIVQVMRGRSAADAVRELTRQARGRMSDAEEGQPCKPDDLSILVFRRARPGA